MKSFIDYCSLIWMFHGRGINNKINHLHECLPRIVYKENNRPNFKDLLKKENLFTIHNGNIQSLVELFKVKENFPDTIINNIL